tara:strand:+ start:357 stop:830 length:474 start_codon:yes stop_codon:yes gene_type:complete
MAQLLSGWGRAGFGELAFGEGTIPVTLTAPGAGTTGAPVAGVNAQAIASVPGLAGSVGSLAVLVDGEANVVLTGQSSTSALGTASLITNNNLSVTLNASVSALGSVSTDCKSNVTLVGQELTSSLGVVLVWSRIDENQTPNYTSVTGTQTPSWVEVA